MERQFHGSSLSNSVALVRPETMRSSTSVSQDRDGAPPLLRASRRRWAFVELCFADSGYAGDRLANASRIRVEIVRKPKGQVGFAVHARRWVVERFFARINRNRGLAKDFKASITSAEAFLYAASAMLLRRRSARCG